jgi:hypothetical protein
MDAAKERRRLLGSVAGNQNVILEIPHGAEHRSVVQIRKGERGIWQRRFWEHTRSAVSGITPRIWTTFILTR